MSLDTANQSQSQSFRDLKADNGSTINIAQHLYSKNLVDDVSQRTLKLNSPYKSLDSFGRNDSDIFFGRDQLINQLGLEIASKNLIVLLGRSGIGKSSVVCAGLIRALEKEQVLGKRFKTIIFKPDQAPFDKLRGSLTSYDGGDFSQKEAEFLLSGKPDTWKQIIDRLKPRSPGQWLIFIDQFEQIFTACRDDNAQNKLTEEARNFIRGIAKFAAVSQDSVKLILAMRTEFLDRLSECLPRSLLTRNLLHYCTYVKPMEDYELRLAIKQPAAQHGVEFEQGLVRDILHDTQGQAGALPLLQYALNLLWEDEKVHLESTRMLRTSVYRNSGGVEYALKIHVQKIYENEFKTEEEQKAVRQIFLSLVDVVGEVEIKRVADRAEFKGQVVEDVLKRLEAAKLITIDRDSQRKISTVELAHEYLIRSWDKLREWVNEAKEAIVLKNNLHRDSQVWIEVEKQNKTKAKEELWTGSKLEKVIEFWNAKFFELKLLKSLDPEEEKFINASIEKRDRQQKEREIRHRNRLIASTAIAAVMAGFACFAGWQWNLAERLELQRLVESSKRQLENDQLDALLSAVKAGKQSRRFPNSLFIGGFKEDVENSLKQAVDKVKERNRLQLNSTITSISFSSDDAYIAASSTDGSINLWKSDSTGHQSRKFNTLTTKFGSNNSNEQFILFVDKKHAIKRWKFDKGDKEPDLIAPIPPQFKRFRFSPDGKYLVVWNADREIGIVDTSIRLGEFRKVIGFNRSLDVYNVSFSPDGQLLVAASRDEQDQNQKTIIEIWTVEDFFNRDSFQESRPAFSGKYEDIIKEYEKKSGDESLKMKEITSIAIKQTKKDGVIVVLGDDRGEILVWDLSWDLSTRAVACGVEYTEDICHTDRITDIQFNPIDSNSFATASFDGTIKYWQIHDVGEQFMHENLITYKGYSRAIHSISFDKKGGRLISGGADKTVRLWQVEVANKDFSNLGNSLNQLLKRGCDYLEDYLNNPKLSEDRQLCK